MPFRRGRWLSMAALLFTPAAAASGGGIVPVLWQAGWNSPLNQSDEVMLVRAAGDGGVLTMTISHDQHVGLVRHDADGSLAWNQEEAGLRPFRPTFGSRAMVPRCGPRSVRTRRSSSSGASTASRVRCTGSASAW